jgi:hypothetical protein
LEQSLLLDEFLLHRRRQRRSRTTFTPPQLCALEVSSTVRQIIFDNNITN